MVEMFFEGFEGSGFLEMAFLWRDYAAVNRQKTMTLLARRVYQRVLSSCIAPRYVWIRHFALLANRKCKDNIAS